MIRTPSLAAAFCALSLPAAAATVAADALVTLTVVDLSEGLDVFYEPFLDPFEEAFGAASAASSASVSNEIPGILVLDAATVAQASPVGEADAEVFAADPVFAENLSDAPGSVTIRIDYDLGTSAVDIGPGEDAFAPLGDRPIRNPPRRP